MEFGSTRLALYDFQGRSQFPLPKLDLSLAGVIDFQIISFKVG